MITFEHVHFMYDQVAVLKGINITICEGEFISIMGHNGSGKSTLAKHMNGLLLPSEGSVMVQGLNTLDPKDVWDIRQQVGMVFQNPDNQFVAPTVLDDVAFGLENLGVPRTEMKERIDWALKQVGMLEHEDREPHHLSGGQKQRVAIAGILAMQPRVIVFDESTSMLDPAGRAELMQTIEQLHHQGITIVNITHYPEEAMSADRLLVMNEGEVVLQGPPQHIFQNDVQLSQMKLDVPFSIELARRLRKEGFSIPKEIWKTDELAAYLWTLL